MRISEIGPVFNVRSDRQERAFSKCEKDWLIVWRTASELFGGNMLFCEPIAPTNVVGGEETLRQIGAWDQLSKETQKLVTNKKTEAS